MTTLRAVSSGAPPETDDDLLSQLTDEHGRMVRAIILHMIHDASMAEDLAQEAFLRRLSAAGSSIVRRGTSPSG